MDNMLLIDLSQSIFDKMPVYPNDGPVNLFQVKDREKDFYNDFRLEIGMHVGTHIDSPMHLTENTKVMADYSLETFIGNGCLLDVKHQKTIGYKKEFSEKVKTGDIVLLMTGHSSEFRKKTYFDDFPIIDKDLAEFLIDRNIKMLGIDAPSPDKFPFEIHKMLFNQHILIIENMTNIEKIIPYNKFEIMAFPLKIKADSSLVRVVARIVE
jgi:kynurenine formamidase